MTLISDFIGNTPLRRDARLSSSYGTNIYIKEEWFNRGRSSKDRAAWFMVEDAIRTNKIAKGGIFVEASSGNTGISMAWIARELGYKAKIFVSASCSEEKIETLESLGAEIERCDNSNGLHVFNSTQYRAQAYAANHPNAYFTNQYYSSNNIKAHYRTTGPELWEQTLGLITHVLIGVGTGGTISGVGRFLKEQNAKVKIWGVEPNRSVYSYYMNDQPIPNHEIKFDPIEGIGRTFIPGSFDRKAVDKIFQIGNDPAEKIARQFAKDTGELIGFSSAAVLASVDLYLKEMHFKPEDHVVLFFPDHGDRYINKLYKGIKLIDSLHDKQNESV